LQRGFFFTKFDDTATMQAIIVERIISLRS
jgi:hypothetical protein